MASVEEKIKKLREDRIAREKARIEKLREINLKKYNNSESNPTPRQSTSMIRNKIATTSSLPAVKKNVQCNINSNLKPEVKNHSTQKDIKSSTANKIVKQSQSVKAIDVKPKITEKVTSLPDVNHKNAMKALPEKNTDQQCNNISKVKEPALNTDRKPLQDTTKNNMKTLRRSLAPKCDKPKDTQTKSVAVSQKAVPSKSTQNNFNLHRESVFDRLYKPKTVPKIQIDYAHKLRTDPNYLKKVIKNTELILNKRHTVFEQKSKPEALVRRSISAVHFKRIDKNELSNCIHKWSSIGDKLNKVHLKEINEDESVKEEKIVSAVKSERKKVKFQTPIPTNFNTPNPVELQSKLKSWLEKRGKSLDSYHHLQCFGLHHLPQREMKDAPKFELYDDEDRENVALECDSDNDSYTDNVNEKKENLMNVKDSLKWRRASLVSDSVDFNETHETTITSEETPLMHHVDELLLGALNDLTELLKEGFDWDQCARWLRAIRERFPSAPDSAAYWECRAALEERRGDLPASVQCWEEAIAKGTERSVVEANLDQLLDKFMQLKISPNSGKKKQVDPKMVDVKNVFKSTIIRFAVQQAKLRQSNQSEQPKYTVTPVRRSGRLSAHWNVNRTPLQICTSVRQVTELGHNVVFVPNDKLHGTP